MSIVEFNSIKCEVIYEGNYKNFYLRRNEMSLEEFHEILSDLKENVYNSACSCSDCEYSVRNY